MKNIGFTYELYTQAGDRVLAQRVSGARLGIMLEHIAKTIYNEEQAAGETLVLKMVNAQLDENTVIDSPTKMESLNTIVTLAAEHYTQKAGKLVIEDFSLQPKTQHDYNTRRAPNQTSVMRKLDKRHKAIGLRGTGNWDVNSLKASKEYNGSPSDRPKSKGLDQLSGSWITDGQEKSIRKSMARNLKKVLADPKKTKKLKEMVAELELPNLEIGDVLKVGKFKNRPAEIKGFSTDEHGQPVADTTKGDQKIFKPRVAKLEPGADKGVDSKDTHAEEPLIKDGNMKEAEKSRVFGIGNCPTHGKYKMVSTKSTANASCPKCQSKTEAEVMDSKGKKTKQVK